jgi:hypothetical protein
LSYEKMPDVCTARPPVTRFGYDIPALVISSGV